MLQPLQEQEAELEVLLGEIEALRQELEATRRPPVLLKWLSWLGRTAQPALPWVAGCVVVACLCAVWGVVLPHVFGWRQSPTPRADVPGTTSACATGDVCTGYQKGVDTSGHQGNIQVPSFSALPGHCVEVDGNGNLVSLPTACSLGASGSGNVTTVGAGSANRENYAPVMSNGELVYCSEKAPSADASGAVCYHVTGNGGGWTIVTPTRILGNAVYGPPHNGIRLYTESAPSFRNNAVYAPVSPPAP